MRAALLVAIALTGCGRLDYVETPNVTPRRHGRRERTSLASAMIGFGAGAYVPTTGAGDAQFESITVTSR